MPPKQPIDDGLDDSTPFDVPVEHRLLNCIGEMFLVALDDRWNVESLSEAVEFTDPDTGEHFEIVVRRIDGRD